MKRKLLGILTGMAAVLMLAGGQTMAQDVWTIECQVPFEFYAFNTRLPPGLYVVTSGDTDDASVLFLENRATRVGLFLETDAAAPEKTAQGPYLTFDTIGGTHFLTGVWFEGEVQGYRTHASRLRNKLLKDNPTIEKQVVDARHAPPKNPKKGD